MGVWEDRAPHSLGLARTVGEQAECGDRAGSWGAVVRNGIKTNKAG